MSTQTLSTQRAHGLLATLRAEYARYIDAVSYLPTNKLRLQEDLRRYLCLRCAGFLEQVTYVALEGYLDQRSSGPVHHFASSHLSVPNLRYDPFRKLIGRFGDTALDSFDKLIDGPRKDALSDLFEVRNQVAHGGQQGGVKLNPDRYIRLCEDVCNWLVTEFMSA